MTKRDPSTTRPTPRPVSQAGFVLPIVLVSLVLLSVFVAARLQSSMDDRQSSQGLRHAAAAFYAAEAGAGAIRAAWSDTAQSLDSLVNTLGPGDSLIYGGGWQSLPSGNSYQAVIRRLSDTGQRLYMLSVVGRDTRGAGGETALRFTLTPAPGGQIALGACCSAAVTVRGTARIADGVDVNGMDATPSAWASDSTCLATATSDKIGVLTKDQSKLSVEGSSVVSGVPPIQEDTAMGDIMFDQYGDRTWDDIRNQADHIVTQTDPDNERQIYWGGDPATDPSLYGPRYNADGSCDTSNPLNFGSPDPNSTCYDYFPVILLQGDVDLRSFNGYAQGIFILDVDPATGLGAELDLEGATVNGVIIGKGCVEIQAGSNFHGAIYVDGTYFDADMCDPDKAFEGNDDSGDAAGPVPAEVHYSTCAVERSLMASGLAEFTGTGFRGVMPIRHRAFQQALR